jgi:histidyl-tRNA synthetase
MKIEPRTLKGFRDFLPKEARKRQYVLSILKEVFESYGFEPLETPALEYDEILSGKYGEEGDKLMYRFEDNGGRKVALRYDQTVPLARVIAQYANDLPLPFKRYQIQNVYRAENTQKGRYREFLQVDLDNIGSEDPISDAEIIAIASECLDRLGMNDFKVLINDRNIFYELTENGVNEKDLNSILRTIDKIEKIGREGVLNELSEKTGSNEKATEILTILEQRQMNFNVEGILYYLKSMGVKNAEFTPLLARGLDYYTSTIFEIKVDGYDSSIAGGGRYDNLIGMFSGKEIPAVGFAFGFDRLMEVLDEKNLFSANIKGIDVLITFDESDSEREFPYEAANILRESGFNVEQFTDNRAIDKQLKYADKKQIPFVLIAEYGELKLKNMKTGEQKKVSLNELPNAIKQI